MQDLRGWSALQTGVAFLPAGLVGLLVASRVAPLIQRFGLPQVIAFGFALTVLAYGLFLRIGVDSGLLDCPFPNVRAGRLRLRVCLWAAEHRGDQRHLGRRTRACQRHGADLVSVRRGTGAAIATAVNTAAVAVIRPQEQFSTGTRRPCLSL